jgi:DNA-3-methyladenine glycosylase I
MSQPVNCLKGEDGQRRCWWCGDDPLYIQYHDQEWGRPVADDQRLFEKMCLEGFQAGLSWITILKKRQAFRESFCDFDFHRVARFRKRQVQRLLANAAIVRHRGKIESTVNNAQRAIELIDQQGSLAAFFWQFEPPRAPTLRSRRQVQATSPQSIALSKELKQRGWSFVGPTTCYALMQAMGMVNDHLRTCHAWSVVDQARKDFQRPGQAG